MSKPPIGPSPYQQLGEHLRQLRDANKESLDEVSGAVEIDSSILANYEAGTERPDEDILHLLINHFQLPEVSANQLWEMAGYGDRMGDDALLLDDAMAAAKQLVMVLALDGRTMYTDGVSIDCNKSGLQISFTQSSPANKPMLVSRVGMSYDQASELAKALSVALTYARFGNNLPLLPPGQE